MPNHVASNLTMTGDEAQIKAIIEKVSVVKEGEEKEYDFNLLYPCPDELHGVSSPVRIVSEGEYQKALVAKQKAIEEGKNGLNYAIHCGLPVTAEQSDELIKKYGTNNWYDWCNANWGTKWGLYGVAPMDCSFGHKFYYETAWSPASEFFIAVSKMYPDVLFGTIYADEGGGFVGGEEYQNGEVISNQDYPWESREGISIREDVGYGPSEDEEEDEEADEPSDDVTDYTT